MCGKRDFIEVLGLILIKKHNALGATKLRYKHVRKVYIIMQTHITSGCAKEHIGEVFNVRINNLSKVKVL